MLAGFPNKLFRAEVLETAVVTAVTEMLLAMPDLNAEVEAAIRTVMEQQSPPKADQIAKLKERRAALTQKINAMLDMIAVAAEEAKAKIFILKKEQREIDDQLRLAAETVKAVPQDPAALVASIMDRLKALGTSISGLPTYQLRQVLASIIASATISMVTGEVQIIIRIPQATLSDRKTAIETLSLRQSSPSSTLSQDQRPAFFPIAKIQCQFMREAQRSCVRCKRRVA